MDAPALKGGCLSSSNHGRRWYSDGSGVASAFAARELLVNVKWFNAFLQDRLIAAIGEYRLGPDFRHPEEGKMSADLPKLSPTQEEWRPSSNPWFIAVAVMLATFVEVLDTTIVSVATPNIAGALAATPDEATRVLTCYLIANAIVLPASGWLSLRFGRKRLILACTILFAVASFLCGSAPSMNVLLVCSALQGVAGGAMVPLSQAILMESFPPARRGMAMACFHGWCSPAIGPVIRLADDNYSWRWVFLLTCQYVCSLLL
jgi:DHA2 family multidrug resistance protein